LGNQIKIVITGPESSGKTTLATALSQYFGTKPVPEFARIYLQFLGRPYQPADLHPIFNGQMAWESFFAQKNEPVLICDTDWTVLQIWENNLHPDAPFQFPRRPWDLALLCTPDIPWEEDPLREHPMERERLFYDYRQLLKATGLPFVELSGNHDKRMTDATAAIQRLSSPLQPHWGGAKAS
jgi:nicotinamide riboside kinase